MPRQMTEEERQEFLAGFHVAVLSVSRGARPPHATPVWYAYRPGGEVTFFTGTQGRKSRKADLIDQAGKLSLTVQQEEFPYKYVTVEGTVVEENEAPSVEQMVAIVRRYLPEDDARAYVNGEMESGVNLVLFTIRPDRWAGLDFGEDAG